MNRCPPEEVGKFPVVVCVGTRKVFIGRDRWETLTEVPPKHMREIAFEDPILRFLNDKKAMPRREIAKALGLTPGTRVATTELGMALSRLKKRGLVVQEPKGWSPAVHYKGEP